MSARRSLNARRHAIPDDVTWIEFERSDGDPSLRPSRTTEAVDDEGCINWMRPMEIDENIAILWRKTVGKFVAQAMGKPPGTEYVLKSWPEGYQLFDHNKGPAGNPRHDPYLYGSTNALRFRSANEFAPHAAWLLTDPTLNRANCQCKYCAKKPQREITEHLGLPTKRPADSSPSNASRREKRLQETRPTKPPLAGVRRAPKPPKQRLTGPTQWLVPEKNNDIRDALGQRDVKTIRYFRRGELVWCSIRLPIMAPSTQDDGIAFWPGLIDVITTKPEVYPRKQAENASGNLSFAGITKTSSASLSSASRPPSPGVFVPHVEITWRVRQHTSYRIKLLATSSSILLSEDEVLPYLAYAPSDRLLDILRHELPEAMRTPAVKELDDREQKMFAFDPCAQADELSRFKQAVAPYTLAIHIASKMATFWTPTDEWECKFTLPSSPPTTFATPALSQPSHPADTTQSPSPQTLINSAMSSDAQGPGTSNPSSQPVSDVNTRILGETLRPPAGTTPQVITQLRYQGLWWGAERIWTDELVRLKLARCQFAPQGSDVVKTPAPSGESTIKFNAERGVESDKQLGGAAEKGLFMLLEGLFVVEVPHPEGSGTIKECRASGMLFELVDEDWQEPDPEIKSEKGENGEGRAEVPPIPGLSLNGKSSEGTMFTNPNVPPVSSTSNGQAPVTESASAPARTQTAVSSQGASLNSQLPHPVLANAYPLPDPPKGYKFRPILAPGHEVVLSLSLISGRYYSHIIEHPQLQPALRQASALAQEDESGLYLFRHLWALEGLLAGVHQSMEPKYWKNGRHIMFKEATAEAKEEFKNKLDELQRDEVKKETTNEQAEDIVMQDASPTRLGAVSHDPMIDPLLVRSTPAVSVPM